MLNATFRCDQKIGTMVKGEDEKPTEVHLVTLTPNPHTGDNEAVWSAGKFDALLKLGTLPAEVAARFQLGRSYRITIEPVE